VHQLLSSDRIISIEMPNCTQQPKGHVLKDPNQDWD